jgi:archaemetzincin
MTPSYIHPFLVMMHLWCKTGIMFFLRIFLFLLLLSWSCQSIAQNSTIVAIQAFASFDESTLQAVEQTIQSVYGFQTRRLPAKPLPESAFVHIKSPRYRADTLLRHLRRNLPPGCHHVLGLTDKDISTTKRDINNEIKKPESKYTDWGIMGLGHRPGPCSIVSTYRLGGVSESLKLERLKKVCAHELGHNLGLPHCTYSKECIMRDAAETVRTLDQVSLKLCNACKARIY